jgi:hypothetical protein
VSQTQGSDAHFRHTVSRYITPHHHIHPSYHCACFQNGGPTPPLPPGPSRYRLQLTKPRDNLVFNILALSVEQKRANCGSRSACYYFGPFWGQGGLDIIHVFTNGLDTKLRCVERLHLNIYATLTASVSNCDANPDSEVSGHHHSPCWATA